MTTILLFLALAFGGIQNPEPQQEKGASVEGIVTQVGSGKAVADAAVELSTPGNALTRYTAAVTADGRFSFKDIPPGQYRLAATSRGFVRTEYGQLGPNGRGLVLTLTSGEEKKNANIALVATGSIAGRIRDNNGAPLANVQVFALKYTYANGGRGLTPAKATLTDDLGEYRLFWLPPADYVVLAAPLRGELGDFFISAAGANYTISNYLKPPSGKPIDVGSTEVMPMYFPGATQAENANAVKVAPGADVRAIDITIKPPKSVVIRGTVSLPAGRGAGGGAPTGPMQVRVMPRGKPFADQFGSGQMGAVDRTGKFEIVNVPPGSYTLTFGSNQAFGVVDVDAFNDVDNVTLPLAPNVDIPIRVSVEGDAAGMERPELAPVRVLVLPPGSPRSVAATPVPQQPPGNFIVRGAPLNEVQFVVSSLPPNAYVKSMRLGPADVLQSPLKVSRSPDSPVEIVLSLNGGRTSGTAVNSRQEPLANAAVVLVPNEPRRGRLDLYRQAYTDASGQFRISGIAPGDYKLFAWEDVPANAWQYPDFIKAYETRGAAVHLEESGSENRQLTVIPIGN